MNLTLVIAVYAAIALAWFLARTRYGRAIRASAANPDAAALAPALQVNVAGPRGEGGGEQRHADPAEYRVHFESPRGKVCWMLSGL